MNIGDRIAWKPNTEFVGTIKEIERSTGRIAVLWDAYDTKGVMYYHRVDLVHWGITLPGA